MLNESAIDRLQEWGGPNLVKKMVRLFLDTSHQRVDQVRDGLANDGLTEAERGAHSLKSSAANLGATELQEISASMERLLSVEDTAAALELLPHFEDAHCQAIDALTELEATLP